MVKNQKKKATEKNGGTAALVCDRKQFKNVLLQKVFEIMTRNSPVSLIVVSHGIPQAVKDSWTVDLQRHLPSCQACWTTFDRN